MPAASIRRCLTLTALLACSATALYGHAQQATPSAEARQNPAADLLQRTVAHYNQANSLEIRATERSEDRNPLRSSSVTFSISAAVASGGRFRYEGESPYGAGLLVSDGTSEWHLTRNFNQYTRQPAGTLFHGSFTFEGDNWALSVARDLLSTVGQLDAQASNIRFLPDQPCQLNGRRLRCRVLRLENPISGAQLEPASTTVWIDAEHLLVARIERRSRSRVSIGGKPTPFGPVNESIDNRTFTTARIDFTPVPGLFHFAPPAEAAEVAELPTSYPAKRTQAQEAPSPLLGRTLPAITLEDASGRLPLSTLRGHPTLISVWATWCGPCMNELPRLERLRRSVASTDLALLSIDQDEGPETAATLLRQRGYPWHNLHAGRAAAESLGVDRLPTLLLADASGTIVYLGHFGDGNALLEAIRRLGPAYAAASLE